MLLLGQLPQAEYGLLLQVDNKEMREWFPVSYLLLGQLPQAEYRFLL